MPEMNTDGDDQAPQDTDAVASVLAPVSQPRRRLRISRGSTALLLVIGLVALGASGYYLSWATNETASENQRLSEASDRFAEQQEKLAAQQRVADRAAAVVAAEAQRVTAEEQMMAREGYEPAGDGLYYRWAELSEFNCGYWDCAYLYVLTRSESCPRSVYVEANIMSGSTAIGMTNATVGGLGPYSSASLLLEDYVGGDSFQLTEINCY
jgi:hypothetical protein